MLTVEFTVAGIPCLGLNGGSTFKHSEAFSFQIATDDQEETDRYWSAIVGYGGSAIIGYVLSLLALPKRVGAHAQAGSRPDGAADAARRDRYLLAGTA